MMWSVGVTTASRPKPTIARTLASLSRAGWISATVFADGLCDTPPRGGVDYVCRDRPIGAFSNWWTALNEIYMREPRADYYLLAEDDVVFCRSAREHVESIEPPENAGVLSLYAAAGSEGERVGFSRVVGGKAGFGALAYVWTREMMLKILSDKTFAHHRANSRKLYGNKHQDEAVARFCRARGLFYMVHTPSLCQHIGLGNSAIGHDSRHPKRKSATFPGEDFDAREFLLRVGQPVVVCRDE